MKSTPRFTAEELLNMERAETRRMRDLADEQNRKLLAALADVDRTEREIAELREAIEAARHELRESKREYPGTVVGRRVPAALRILSAALSDPPELLASDAVRCGALMECGCWWFAPPGSCVGRTIGVCPQHGAHLLATANVDAPDGLPTGPEWIASAPASDAVSTVGNLADRVSALERVAHAPVTPMVGDEEFDALKTKVEFLSNRMETLFRWCEAFQRRIERCESSDAVSLSPEEAR